MLAWPVRAGRCLSILQGAPGLDPRPEGCCGFAERNITSSPHRASIATRSTPSLADRANFGWVADSAASRNCEKKARYCTREHIQHVKASRPEPFTPCIAVAMDPFGPGH